MMDISIKNIFGTHADANKVVQKPSTIAAVELGNLAEVTGRRDEQGLPIETLSDEWLSGSVDVLTGFGEQSDAFLKAVSGSATEFVGDLLGGVPFESETGAFDGDAEVIAQAKVQQAWESAIALLTDFAGTLTSAEGAQSSLQESLGEQWTADGVRSAIAQLSSTDMPSLSLLSLSELGAKGAFAAENNTIYLAEDWATTQSMEAVVDVLLEEMGHFVDAQLLDGVDTAGDEGAIFSALVQGKQLAVDTLTMLRAEDDSAQLQLDGQTLAVEQAAIGQKALNRSKGTFVVNRGGRVKVDFLFDGNPRAGQVALFNLAGMGRLSSKEFAKVAAKRALKGGSTGQIIINDLREGAQFDGKLGGRSFNKGRKAKTKSFKIKSGTRFGLIMVNNGTIAEVASGKKRQTVFSIPGLNPQKKTLLAKATKDIFAFEDNFSQRSDRDFNDVVFRMQGVNANVTDLSKVINKRNNWLERPTQPFLDPKFSNPNPPKPPVTDPKPDPDPNPDPGSNPDPKPPTTGGGNPPATGFLSDISTKVSKFKPSSSEAEIKASGAQRIQIGSQTIYIGTQQVSSINQNPIIRSVDPKNPRNNWVRTDIETTGTDGRGLGLFYTGKKLYGVFSVDGTQGSSSQDFRRATGGATQSWLKSYGRGGGGKIAVIGEIDPTNGKLLRAAHLSAVLSDGRTNSLFVEGASVNKAGNIVIKAQSFFNPRRPDGKQMTKNPGNNAGSPFDYTIEINDTLTTVIRTSAPGWSQ